MGRKALLLLTLMAAMVMVSGTALAAITYTTSTRPALKLNKASFVGTALTRLVSNAVGPALTLETDSTNPSATPLKLQTETGSQAPMSVNPEAGTATNLSADELDGKNSTDFVSGAGSMTTVDEGFSDPDHTGGNKGFSSVLSVPGAQIRAACLEQSNGIEMFLNRTSDVNLVSLWRDDGGADPTVKMLHSDPFDPSADSDSSPVSAADHVIWRGASAAGTFTAELFTRYERGGRCHWSGYVLSTKSDGTPPDWDQAGNQQ